MEGERLPQVTVELEGKKGRGRKKHEKKKSLESGRRAERKLESPNEEIHNEYRAKMDQV